MNWGRTLAIVQIVVCIAAAIGYAFAGDWRRVIYWVSAAVLTSSVTF